jgi:hypothetical protein
VIDEILAKLFPIGSGSAVRPLVVATDTGTDKQYAVPTFERLSQAERQF